MFFYVFVMFQDIRPRIYKKTKIKADKFRKPCRFAQGQIAHLHRMN